jgi:hypothetical protein
MDLILRITIDYEIYELKCVLADYTNDKGTLAESKLAFGKGTLEGGFKANTEMIYFDKRYKITGDVEKDKVNLEDYQMDILLNLNLYVSMRDVLYVGCAKEDSYLIDMYISMVYKMGYIKNGECLIYV